MDSNYHIMCAVISCYTFPPKSLKTLADYTIDIPTPAYVSFPDTEQMNGFILRGADFKSSCQDHILLDDSSLHYSIVHTKPVTLVYSCLCGPALKGHLAQDFLQSIQTCISNNPSITFSLSNPSSDLFQFRADMDSMLKNMMMEANKKNIFANSTVIDLGNAGGLGVQPLSKVSDLQKQVEEVKTVMSDNMIRILERGDRLENIDHRTEALHASSQNFKTTARRVQRNMCWKNLKWTIILGAFLTILVTLIILFVLKQLGVFSSKMIEQAITRLDSDWIFQQDNNPKHASKLFKKWFKDNDVNVLK